MELNIVLPRGGKRRVELLEEDFNDFYKGFYRIKKVRLSYIFRGLTTNPLEIILLAIFLGISSMDLSKREITNDKSAFDEEVLELHRRGYSCLRISRELKVNHSTISNIVNGIYNYSKKKRYSTYKSPKFDWDTIEKNCLKRFDEAIQYYNQLGFIKITKAMLAEYYGLKDKSLRNLKILKAKLRRYNNESRNN